MNYRIKLSPDAEEHLEEWKHSGQIAVLQKLAKLFDELEGHPMTGTGKPERLRGNLQGYWSRRITKADRLVYCIHGEEILVSVVSLKGHYGDK